MTLAIRTFSLGPLQTNAYLLQDADTGRGIIVDPGMNPGSLVRAIEGMTIEAILLTHAHFDHMAGVDEVRRVADCPVYLHPLEQDWMTSPKLNGSLMWPQVTQPVTAAPAEYDLGEGQVLELIGHRFLVYHTPGHSPGSVSFHCGSDLFGGDVLFRMGVGRTDLPGGRERDLIDSVHRLYRLDDQVTVYPGHGPKTTIGYEKENNPYIR
ncbi:MBL fold metallo-hydrolase [Paenibacillus sp. P96]|uniref:MBL fold metallo-hydrolase n=1 Tax=Paenibacillus zeirhizosphaerae TaxID=2987519 RepID=A0ABT9FTZ2_9BACL|nr:MBL fold metallo-hydrolase [Paenibacillus sp. P96]MDP4098090.1 MBL fold metallo-hydrolase [Paenibacillus sp. P96]